MIFSPWLARWRRACPRRTQRLLFGAALVFVAAWLRLPWIEADVGSPGIWPYGAFAGDEGEYTGGGRLYHLTGRWIDPEMAYPSTLGYAPAMHWFSALAHAMVGPSSTASRAPSVCAAVVAWLAAYLLASRITAPWLAGILTLAISCNPLSLIYERWGSSDVMFGAEAVVACALLARGGPWRSTAAGLVAGLAMLTKSSALLFAPLFAGLLFARPRARRASAFGFGLAFGLVFAGGELWAQRCMAPALSVPLRPEEFPEVGAIVNFTIENVVKALAIFPRATTALHLGPFMFWLFLLPAWVLAASLTRGGARLSPRVAMSAGLLLFVAGLATQTRNPSRYFLPLLYFAPLILVYGRQTLLRTRFRTVAFQIALLLVGLALFFFYWEAPGFPSNGSLFSFSSAYRTPQRIAWAATWPMLLAGGAGLLLVAGLRLGWRGGFRHQLLLLTLALGAAWLFSSSYGVFATASGAGASLNQLLVQLAALGGFGIFLAGRRQVRWMFWYAFAAQLFFATAILNPCWNRSYPTLLRRTHATRAAAERLASKIPPDAAVIGRRASTLLLNTRARLGLFNLCSAGKGEADALIQRIRRLMETAPKREVYWVFALDELPLYVAPDQKEIQNAFHVEILAEDRVPGNSNPQPVLLFLLRLTERPPLPPKGALGGVSSPANRRSLRTTAASRFRGCALPAYFGAPARIVAGSEQPMRSAPAAISARAKTQSRMPPEALTPT